MIALLIASSLLATEYRFVTPDHEITMTVRFEPPYRGTPLRFFDGGRPQCYTGKCIEKFHGAAAVVNFIVAKAHGKAPKVKRFRELVTIIEQSPDMPATPPFDLTLSVADGKVSDLQVMGYDEDEIPGAERERMRVEAPGRMWRKARQELYLNGAAAPFAVIEWRHTMQGITIEAVTGWRR